MLFRGLGLGKSACNCQGAISVVDPSSITAGSCRQLTAFRGCYIEYKSSHGFLILCNSDEVIMTLRVICFFQYKIQPSDCETRAVHSTRKQS